MVAATSSALSFASGVVGAVMAGQRRQRVWFVALLLTLVFATYAGIAIIMIPALTQFFYIVEPIQGLSDSTNNPLLRLEMVNYVITPLLAPIREELKKLESRRSALEKQGEAILITVAAQRAKQLQNGAKPRVEAKTRKPTRVAIEEVLANAVSWEMRETVKAPVPETE
jgi:hypothetical protein